VAGLALWGHVVGHGVAKAMVALSGSSGSSIRPPSTRRGIASMYDLRDVGAVGVLSIFGGDSTWCFWRRDT
jgi:hypothetical protein